MITSDVIRQAIREKVSNGTTLSTPGGAELVVESVKPTEVVILVGKNKKRVSLTLDCINDLVKEFRFLPPGGWLRINPSTQLGLSSLDNCLREHTNAKNIASSFAAVLEHAGVVEISKGRPARIRLLV